MKVVRCSDSNYDRITEYAEESGFSISQCVNLAIEGFTGAESAPRGDLIGEIIKLRDEISQIRWGMTVEEKQERADERVGGPISRNQTVRELESPSLMEIMSTVTAVRRKVDPPAPERRGLGDGVGDPPGRSGGRRGLGDPGRDEGRG